MAMVSCYLLVKYRFGMIHHISEALDKASAGLSNVMRLLYLGGVVTTGGRNVSILLGFLRAFAMTSGGNC